MNFNQTQVFASFTSASSLRTCLRPLSRLLIEPILHRPRSPSSPPARTSFVPLLESRVILQREPHSFSFTPRSIARSEGEEQPPPSALSSFEAGAVSVSCARLSLFSSFSFGITTLIAELWCHLAITLLLFAHHLPTTTLTPLLPPCPPTTSRRWSSESPHHIHGHWL
eukprot:1173110-Rhodomonas_salina.1